MTTYRNLFVLACCCLTLCLVPLAGHAEAAGATETAGAAAAATPAVACAAGLTVTGIEDPVQLSPCFVSVTCSDGSTVSCSGNNSCTTSGTNNRCVTCDGVQQGCCAITACEQCDINYWNCISTCEFPFECNRCDRFYDRCLEINNC